MSFFSRLFKIFSVKNEPAEILKSPEPRRREPVMAEQTEITPDSVNAYFSAAAKRAEDEATYYMLSSLNCVSVKIVRKPNDRETVFTFETENPQENIEMLQEQLALGLSLKYGENLNPRVVLIGKIPVPPKIDKAPAIDSYEIKPITLKPANPARMSLPQTAPPPVAPPRLKTTKLSYEEDDVSDLPQTPVSTAAQDRVISEIDTLSSGYGGYNRITESLTRGFEGLPSSQAPNTQISEKPAPAPVYTPETVKIETPKPVISPEPQTASQSNLANAQKKESFPKTKIKGFKAVIAVASGKGGVGKSSIALGLARAFVKRGISTALLDTDLHGPSAENMSGEHERVRLNLDKTIPAVERHGLQIASVGFTTEPGSAVVLRGPMVSGVIKQLIDKTSWKNNPEVLIIDTPPGTGDAHLTLFRDMQIDGVYMVSTAHRAAISDTKRSISFIKRLETPIFGIIDNMNGFSCDECGKEHFVFKNQAVRKLANEEDIHYFGALPISEDAMIASQNGTPISDCGDEEFRIFFDRLVNDCLSKTDIQENKTQAAERKVGAFEIA